MLRVRGIVAEVVDQVAPVHVEHRPDGNERAEAQLIRQAPVENGGAQCAALADEADVAGQSERFGKRCIQTDVRQHHADAVRTDDPHLAALGENLVFQFRASRSALFEASGDNHCAFHIRRGAFRDDRRDRARRSGDDRKIDTSRHAANRWASLLSKDRFPIWINRKQIALERFEIFHQRASDTIGSFGSAD